MQDQRSNTSEPMTIGSLIRRFKDRLQKDEPPVDLDEFRPAFGDCELHGQYPLNMRDKAGVIRWIPDVCPVCRRELEVKALFARADIAPRFLNCRFDNYHVECEGQRVALDACRDYAANFAQNLADGRCMILRGNPGTGKNHLSTAIMRQVMEAGYTALRLKASAYLDEYWSKEFRERDAWIGKLAAIDLLVLDEVGRASNSKAAGDAFFRLIDERSEHVKPTIVLTNLDRDALIETLGDAAYDRLSENGGLMLHFDWVSSRGKARATR